MSAFSDLVPEKERKKALADDIVEELKHLYKRDERVEIHRTDDLLVTVRFRGEQGMPRYFNIKVSEML